MKDLKEKNLGYSSISKYNLAFFEKEVLELVEADKQGFEFTNSWKVFEQFKLKQHSIVVDRIDRLFEIVKGESHDLIKGSEIHNVVITKELSRNLPDIEVLRQWFKECIITTPRF